MNVAAYPKHKCFKPSGLDWVGDVPEHWDVEKLGSMLTPVSEKNRPDLPLLSITREQGVIERDIEDQDSNHNFIPDDLSGYKVLHEGQFGMNKMKAWQGSYGVSAHTGIVSPAYFIFDFAREVDPHFFNIAIRSKLYVSYFGSASDGVRVGQWDLNQSRMRQIPILLPPIREQRAIAAFLDGKCAKIDEAVRIKEEQIALLRERRQILIQQAVTRGLNPDTPMKDSGIDWIGQIPAHWEVKRFKHFFSTAMGETILAENLIDDGKIPVYSATESDQFFGHVNKSKVSLSVGDIVIPARGNSIGFPKLVAAPATCSQTTIYAKKLREISSEYTFFYLWSCKRFLFQFVQTAIPQITVDEVKNNTLLMPPAPEQVEIVSHCENITRRIDSAIEIKNRQIAALKEYKTSLINAAVTGKIKVI
jgi:type I restriction enzyme S subunit